MYQTVVKGEGLFQASSEGYGETITTFGTIERGETPVSLVNIALASCVTMCVQGYYASQEGNREIPVHVSSQLEEKTIRVDIALGETVSTEKQERIMQYVDEKCRVKGLLSKDLVFHVHFSSLS